MKLENSFEVPAPPDDVWRLLLDVERVAPCMPGAELTEVVDETTWKGKVNVRLGAVSLTYRGKVEVAEKDEAGRRIVLKASGQEMRGKGTASAAVTSRLEETTSGTRVDIETDMTLSGAAAQLGGGMIADVSRRLTGQFADCLKAQLQPPAADGTGTAAQPTPQAVKGGRLAIWALGQAILRFFRNVGRSIAKLFGRGGG